MSFTNRAPRVPPSGVLNTSRTDAMSVLPRVVYRLRVEGSPNPVTLALWGLEGGYAITVNEVDKVCYADVSTV